MYFTAFQYDLFDVVDETSEAYICVSPYSWKISLIRMTVQLQQVNPKMVRARTKNLLEFRSASDAQATPLIDDLVDSLRCMVSSSFECHGIIA
jgi:hypothetical protein